MGFPLILVGLIFLLNQTTWFGGEDRVGWILLIVGAVITALHALAFVAVASKANKVRKDVSRDFQRRGGF